MIEITGYFRNAPIFQNSQKGPAIYRKRVGNCIAELTIKVILNILCEENDTV